MALTKISTDTIDLSSDTTGLKMPKGTTGDRPGTFSCSYLIVGGGGAGGAGTGRSGGGGAGAFVTASGVVLQPNVAYGIEVGAGGLIPGLNANANGGNGSTSTFNSITAIGGGGGGGFSAGSSGASGGGGAADSPGTHSGGSGTQGNNGGTGYYSGSNFSAGGGGGAGAAGQSGSLGNYSGAGGVGLITTLITTAMATTYSVGEVDSGNVYFAGGGGGGWSGSGVPGVGGLGGGADGNSNTPYVPGAPNSGGGGGGFYKDTGSVGCCAGTNGGSGVIILSVEASSATVTSGVTVNGSSGAGTVSGISNGSNYVYIITVAGASDTITFSGSAGEIGMMRENSTTGKMEIYTGAKGWRALQQTGQDVGITPSRGFGAALYIGSGGASSINLDFQPDLIWIKGRDTNGKFHALYDSVRGATNMISTNSTDYGSWNPYGSVTPNTSGFDIGSASAGDINTNTENYVSWSWKAGGNSNTFNIDGVGYATAAAAGMNAGSISPNACSVSTEYGFSITKYDSGICGTSNPPCFNWSHGLNQEPDFVTNKMLNYTYGWDTIFKPAGYNGGSNTGGWQYAQLNTNAAMGSTSNHSADSTLLYQTMSAGASYPLVTYAWHSVPGYSLISTYTGTGVSTAMPRIYTGFQPAWLMVKRLDSTGYWKIEDSTRNTSNPRDKILEANSSDGEYTNAGYNINFYNDGFQILNNSADWNAAGGEYLFLCFAS